MRTRLALGCVIVLGALVVYLQRPLRAVQETRGVVQCGDPRADPSLALAVLGDGFTDELQGLFDAASRDLLCNGAIAREPAYRTLAQPIAVTAIRVESGSTRIARSGQASQSALGLVYNGSRSECFFTESPGTTHLIMNEAAEALHRQVFVIVNLPFQDAGCTIGKLTYITRGASWQTIAHELGHIKGLADEYVDLPASPGAFLKEPSNCSRSTQPWWVGAGLAGAGVITGCNRHPDFNRAYENCRMRSLDQPFCAVCTRLLAGAISPPGPAPTDSVEMTLELRQPDGQTGSGSVNIVSSRDVRGATVLPSRLAAGDHIVAALVDGTVASVSALPGVFNASNRLIRRAYGGTGPGMHVDQATDRSYLSLQLPNMTMAALRRRRLDLQIVKLTSAPTSGITSQFLDGADASTVFRAGNLQSQLQ